MRKYLTILFALIMTTVSAQDPALLVEISSDTILMGNYVQLKYTIENAQGKFEMPELDGMRVVSGPNTSTSMSMINGKVTQSANYAVFLEPIDVGTSSVGPVYIETEAGTLEAQPINIIVVDNPNGEQMSPYELKVIEEVELAADGKSKKKKKKAKRFKI